MNFLRVHLGSTRKWLVGFLLFALAGIFSPTIASEWWHIHHPHVVACEAFTVQIPLFWSGDDIDASTMCKKGFVLTRFGATTFGSADNGSSLSVILENQTDRAKKSQQLENAFRETHPDSVAMPYKLNDAFDHCISAERVHNGRQTVDVFCSNSTRGIVVLASGSLHALSEISTFIR